MMCMANVDLPLPRDGPTDVRITRPFRATKGEQPRVLPLAHSDCERKHVVQVTFLRELVTHTTSASCGKLGELGTSQGFLLSVTFRTMVHRARSETRGL